MDKIPYFIVLLIISIGTNFALNIATKIKNERIDKMELRYSNISKIILLYIYIIFIFFSAFRIIEPGLGGIDAYGYKMFFLNSTTTLKESLLMQNYEPGYGIFIWGMRQLTDNYILVLLIVNSFIFLLFINFFKYVNRGKIRFFSIYLLAMQLFMGFNIQRIMVAIFIGTLVYINIYKKKYIVSFCLILFALSIHISSIILIPVLLVNIIIDKKEQMDVKKLVFLVTSIFLFSIIIINMFSTFLTSGKYYVYSNNGGIAVGFYSFSTVLFLLSIKKYKQLIELNPFNKTLITSLPISIVVLPLQMKYSILYRLLLFFIPIQVALLPDLFKVYRVKKNKNISYLMINIFLILYILDQILVFFSQYIYEVGLPYGNVLFN